VQALAIPIDGLGGGVGGEADDSDGDDPLALDQLTKNDLEDKLNQWEELGKEKAMDDNKDVVPDNVMTTDLDLSQQENKLLSQNEKQYEDICRDHLDAYMRSADNYLTETNLTKRVADWQRKLDPLLQEQEMRGPFDIYKYGKQIINSLQGQETKETPTPVIDFSIVVKEQPKFEVCRYFLASLQLANNGNVEVQGLTNAAAAFGENGEPIKFATEDSKTVFQNSMTLKLLNPHLIQTDDLNPEKNHQQLIQSQNIQDENEIIPPTFTPLSHLNKKFDEIPPTQTQEKKEKLN